MRKLFFVTLAFILCATFTADAAKLYPAPIFRWTKDNGAPASGWKVHTYEAGTTTNKATYTDSGAGTPNSNPVILDSRGEAPIYFQGTYKIVIKDDSDVVQATFDSFGTGDAGTSPVVNLINNGSFETDVNGDLLPDEWTSVKYDSGTSTVILISSSQAHGSYSLKFQSLGNGGGTSTQGGYSEINPSRSYQFSFSLLSSVVDVRNVVEVIFYDQDKASVSTQTVYDESAANPTTMTLKRYILSVPATARFARVKLTGCHSSDATPGYTLFDNIVIQEISNDAGTGTTSQTFVLDSDGTTGTFSISGLTSARTYTVPDKSGTVALVSDIVYENAAEYNPIINGNMDVWQRGTTFGAPASNTYTADRWRVAYVGGVVFNVLASTDVPTVAEAGVRYRYSYLMSITTADTSIAAGDFVSLSHKIEGYNFAPFVGKTATLVFWVKATVTGTYCAAFLSSTRDISYVAEFTVNASNTWEKKTITLDFDYSSGTWDYTSGIGLFVEITLAAGSTYHASAAGSWETGNFRSTSNQVNGVGAVPTYFFITGVGLYFGDTAPSYTKARSRGIEEMLCNRYFWKSFPVETAPVSSSTPGSLVFPSPVGAAAVAHAPSVSFPVKMRAAPTCVIYNPEAAGSQIRNSSGISDFTGSVCVADDEAFHVYGTTPAGTAVGHLCKYQITADAEL